jgi:sugar transferase (PEP-CTERM/EpsH1 system associated)
MRIRRPTGAASVTRAIGDPTRPQRAGTSQMTDRRPLVAHVIYRFDTGGLENGVVNLINHMPRSAFRHMVLALTEVTDFRLRLHHDDVECVAVHKPPGHGYKAYRKVWSLLRLHRPAIVHTRNLAALEMQLPAWLARVPVRIHGEHGRDMSDLDGSNRHYRRLRRLYAPFVQNFVALSRDLAGYLQGPIGIHRDRIHQIYNGVDAVRFAPSAKGPQLIDGAPFEARSQWLIGTVGRMQTVKNQTLLARAFVRALEVAPQLRPFVRLVMVGDGPLRVHCQAILDASGVGDLVWLPGEREDVPDVMRGLNCFVLPSLAEGVSNTILEAMATALPVIATAVGGNAELIDHGRTGEIVPPEDVEAMSSALIRMATQSARAEAMGRAARADVEGRFSLQSMVTAYQGLYDRQLAAAGFRRDND